jgi:putative transcriptional regulator
MIKLRVKDLLKERDRTLYWLRNQTGIRYATLLNMRNGKTSRMDLSAMEALCRALECEPGELLVLQPKLKRKAG